MPGKWLPLHFQKIHQQLGPFECEKTLGVKLDAFDRHGFMANAHDLAVWLIGGPSGDFQNRWAGFRSDDETVVTGGGERVADAGEQALAIVLDLASLAMHEPICPDNFSAKSKTDALMSQANP